MNNLRKLLLFVLALFPSTLFAADPFLGKWLLDPQRSKYPASACPKRMTIEMRAQANGVHYRSETVLPNGRLITADYTAAYNGKPAIVIGDRGMLLPVSLKQTQPRVVVATYTSGFQPVATSRRVVSADGKVMTITTTSQDAAGNSTTNIGIYRRAVHAEGPGFDLVKAKAELLISR